MKQLPAISLRAMEPEDLDLLYSIENNRTLWKFGISNVPYSRYTLRNYIANATGDIYTDHQVRLMIDNEQGQTVGIVDLCNFDAAHRRAEFGIVILNQYQHQGYAMQAIAEMRNYASQALHLHQLFAYVDTDNTPCLQLFRKMGFLPAVELQDWLYDGEKYRNALFFQIFF